VDAFIEAEPEIMEISEKHWPSENALAPNGATTPGSPAAGLSD
jgi:hypothetical protein